LNEQLGTVLFTDALDHQGSRVGGSRVMARHGGSAHPSPAISVGLNTGHSPGMLRPCTQVQSGNTPRLRRGTQSQCVIVTVLNPSVG
jgi:hypothetical protein